MKTRLSIYLAIVTLICSAVPLAAAKVPSEGWLGLYLGSQKMGYMRLSTSNAQYEGRDCYKVESLVRTKVLLLGSPIQQDVQTVMYTDEHFTPYFQTVEMASGGRKTTIEAKFDKSEVRCKISSDSGQSEKVVPIPEGASLVGDSMYAMGTDKLKVGLKAKMHYFNPLKLAIDPIDVEVLRTEQLTIKDTTYDTFVVRNTTPMGDTTSWLTEEGGIVKSIALMGLTMVVETAEEAMSGIDSEFAPQADLAIMTSVKANIDIRKSESVRRLVVRLTGKLEPKMAISDGWQNARWLPDAADKKVVEFTVESKKFDPKKSLTLPLQSKRLRPYLEPTPYLESEAPEIKAKAAEIVGDEKSAYKAAMKIRSWVAANMKQQTDMGVIRPATDVMKQKSGVCRDYAVLSASLARAAGIPTKVVAGLVYVNGSFYYHAWTESYVGEWVAFDATRPKTFVDATHIKLAEGDATDMFEMVRAFGTLKAEIIKFEH